MVTEPASASPTSTDSNAGVVLSRSGVRQPGRLSKGVAFWLVGGVMGFLLFASSAPSPMYVIYQNRWHFSAITLTSVFAVYALAVLAALMIFGSLSDHVGRRPVLVGSLLVELVAMAVFAGAQGVGWLFVARALQGLATGAATSAISAALIDLQPERNPKLGALVNTISPTVGMAVGALAAGALVAYAPAPTVLTYLLLVGVFALAVLGTLAMPEPVAPTNDGWRRALRPRRVGVPASMRSTFAVTSTSIIAVWAIGGLYLSLGPSLAAGLLHTQSHLVGGLVIFVLTGAGAAAQLGLSRWGARRAMLTGSIALILGLALMNYSLSAVSTVVFFAGTILMGLGFGIAFMGAFRTLVTLAAPEHRAGVISAIYVVAYLAMSVPAIVAGLAVPHLGLRTTTLIFSAVVAALATLAALGAARPRQLSAR